MRFLIRKLFDYGFVFAIQEVGLDEGIVVTEVNPEVLFSPSIFDFTHADMNPSYFDFTDYG